MTLVAVGSRDGPGWSAGNAPPDPPAPLEGGGSASSSKGEPSTWAEGRGGGWDALTATPSAPGAWMGLEEAVRFGRGAHLQRRLQPSLGGGEVPLGALVLALRRLPRRALALCARLQLRHLLRVG